ncbi:DUF2339 domain-containing protein [Mesorhizobium atlanticum]
MVTPSLVASQAPNPWALFVYLAIVLAASAATARFRDWKALMAAAFVGTGVWTILYMVDARDVNLAAVLFISLATLAVLAFVWLGLFMVNGREGAARGFDWPSIVPGFSIALTAMGLSVDPAFASAGDALHGAVLLAALVGVALYPAARSSAGLRRRHRRRADLSRHNPASPRSAPMRSMSGWTPNLWHRPMR